LRNSRRWLMAIAVLGSLLFAGSSATAAQAAPAVTASPVHASAGNAAMALHANAAPAVGCAVENGYVRTYYNGCVNWTRYQCVALHHFNISPPDYVSDGCYQTVQLWSGQNETGHAICIPGHTASGHLNTSWHSFKITGSGAC
jgi:hypothetical protein